MTENILQRELMKISDEEFMIALRNLARYIKKYPRNFDTIYGIPQNGTIIASILAKLLNIRFVNSVMTTRTLIVDDISDTGKTLQPFRERFPDNIIATVYFRETTDVMPDMVTEDVKDKWVRFAFEKSIEEEDA